MLTQRVKMGLFLIAQLGLFSLVFAEAWTVRRYIDFGNVVYNVFDYHIWAWDYGRTGFILWVSLGLVLLVVNWIAYSTWRRWRSRVARPMPSAVVS